jgi:hypothetical protein
MRGASNAENVNKIMRAYFTRVEKLKKTLKPKAS